MATGESYFARRAWSFLFLVNGLIFLSIGIGVLFKASASWRVLSGLPLIAFGVWHLYLAWLTRARPMITIDEMNIHARSMLARESTRIPRSDVHGVAWWNPGALGIRLGAGDTAAINLIGLGAQDKAAIREAIESGRSGA